MAAKRVLIIEDNPQNLYLLTFLLEKSGYEVRSAMDSSEGVLMAETVNPDVILLDIQLPTMDGYAVAQAIREKPELRAIPIIAVTSYAMPGDKEKALASGCDGYVEKPIDPETFLDTMESFLGKGVP